MQRVVSIPADVKMGYNVNDKTRLSVRAGGNILYRSNASALNLGPSTTVGSSSDWTIYPNAGADFEWQVGKRVSLFARPDFTFTPGNDLFVAMLGLNVML